MYYELVITDNLGEVLEKKSFPTEQRAHDYYCANWGGNITANMTITMMNDDGTRSIFDDIDE